MRNDILQYLSDTVLIEKMSEPTSEELAKQAGLFEDLGLGGIASSIKNFFKGKTFLDIMVPGILFKVHPLFSLIYFAAEKFLGFDVNNIVSSIMGKLRPKLESGQQVTAAEVNAAGKEVISGLGGAMEATASDNMLEHLYELQRNGFFKEAQRRRTPSNIKFFRSRTGSRWGSVFGDLLRTPKRGKFTWLIGGLIIWTLKTALLGAGLLVGAGLMGSVIEKPKVLYDSRKGPLPEDEPATEEVTAPAAQPGLVAPIVAPVKEVPVPALARDPFKASSWGQTHFPNDKNNAWVVPLINRSIDDTLLVWSVKVYPELIGKEHIIESSSGFNRAVDNMSQFYDPASDTLTMPDSISNRQVNTIKQVVDTFSREIARMVKG